MVDIRNSDRYNVNDMFNRILGLLPLESKYEMKERKGSGTMDNSDSHSRIFYGGTLNMLYDMVTLCLKR